MSGGVDSSVAAALLANRGFDCTGAFFITWTETLPGVSVCPWEQDVFDARQVCNRLGIPLYTFNFEREYKQRVIEYFFREYQGGRTPNPDIMCNREIKFNLFLKKARALGFEYIATGHYARVKKIQRGYALHKGKDTNKDQSYFLYTLQQQQLQQTLFPIGGLVKPKVRQLAKKFKLPNAEKKDSQGICFLGKVKLRDFLKTRIPVQVGKIVDAGGKILGEHEGTAFYTIGQRHGLKIGGAGEPYYVVAKDTATNTVVVSNGHAMNDFSVTHIKIGQISWVDKIPRFPLHVKVKIRYRQPDQAAELRLDSTGRLSVNFRVPQRAATPGQSAVFYQGTQLLGGGVIDQIG